MARQVDGQLLLGRAVGFGRALRRAGMAVDLAAAIDFARSLEIVGIEDRADVKAAGAAVFVRRKDDPLDRRSVLVQRTATGMAFCER